MNSPFSLSFYQQSTRYNHKLDAKHYYYKLADVTFNTDICRKQFSSTWKRSKWPQDDNYHLRRYRNLKVKVTHTNTHSQIPTIAMTWTKQIMDDGKIIVFDLIMKMFLKDAFLLTSGWPLLPSSNILLDCSFKCNPNRHLFVHAYFAYVY